MRRRNWQERDHPRWPRGSGDRSGEFRDKNGGDWADRLVDLTQPAGRYGSIATGQTQQCPICGRTVKLVGTSGKLSTHNASKGVRCDGSGMTDPEPGRGGSGGVVQRRATKKPKNKDIKAPEPPKVTVGRSWDLVDDPQAEARMRRWRDGAVRPGTRQAFSSMSRREHAIREARRDMESRREHLADWRRKFRAEVGAEMFRAGWDPAKQADWDNWGAGDEIEHRMKPHRDVIEELQEYIAELESGGDTMRLTGRYQQRFSQAELDAPLGTSGPRATEPAQAYDPAHPLDIYGDLLHIEDDTWFVYQALDTLEQKVPPVYHEIVAAHLASRRGGSQTSFASSSAGIYVSGRKRLPDLDDLGRLRGQRPRGWKEGATFNDPDGVVSGGEVLAVARTENTDRKRSANLRTFGLSLGLTGLREGARRAGNPLADAQIDPSAMDHEFGHMLDAALGSRTSASDASSERLWRLVHGRVKREGGRYLSPYFKQSGDAGPEELWADAFGIWAMTTGDQATLDGAPHQVLAVKRGGMLGNRAVTWRTRAFATEYDIPYGVAFEIEDYFDRLLKEVQSGKRKPKLAR